MPSLDNLTLDELKPIENSGLFVFSGDPSKTRKDLLKKEGCKTVFRITLIIMILSIIPAVLMGVFWTSHAYSIIGIAVLGSLMFIVEPLFGKHYADKIIITSNIIYFVDLHHKQMGGLIPVQNIYIEDLSHIKDLGDGYALMATLGKEKRTYISDICQKDLLIKGTIEEFEEFFEDYIQE